MSEENVDIVRDIYDAAGRRDADALFALYDPKVELDASRLGLADLDVYHGHDGLRRLFREFSETWGEIEYSYEELIDAGDDQVISVVTRHARGRASGADVQHPFALLWTLRNGRVVRVVWYLSREDALAAAGVTD